MASAVEASSQGRLRGRDADLAVGRNGDQTAAVLEGYRATGSEAVGSRFEQSLERIGVDGVVQRFEFDRVGPAVGRDRLSDRDAVRGRDDRWLIN